MNAALCFPAVSPPLVRRSSGKNLPWHPHSSIFFCIAIFPFKNSFRLRNKYISSSQLGFLAGFFCVFSVDAGLKSSFRFLEDSWGFLADSFFRVSVMAVRMTHLIETSSSIPKHPHKIPKNLQESPGAAEDSPKDSPQDSPCHWDATVWERQGILTGFL